ncbi:MAG: YkgJ family cysteine cluster protein [Candidatus Bathyarchaeota archaeon]|nr:YkgJ family cysteine cluster protein [Candidatus Bathyarchaeota archaeon]
MDEPAHYLGHLNFSRDGVEEEIEFYYPSNVDWECIHCKACCGDVGNRVRMILLTDKDIEMIEETGAEDFYENWDEDSFVGIMKKKNGKCIFLTDDGCKIYDKRALLCRMYPFWLEKQGEVFVFGVNHDCPGKGQGESLDEEFFRGLLEYALKQMDY